MYETNEIYRDYSVEYAEKSTKHKTYSKICAGVKFAGGDALLFNLSEICCVKIVTFIHRRSFEAFDPRLIALNLPKSAAKLVCGQDPTERIGHLHQRLAEDFSQKRHTCSLNAIQDRGGKQVQFS